MSGESQEHILVAGGAGYIGCHIAKALRQAGFVPVTLDNLCTGNRESVRFGPFYEGGMHDAALVQRIVATHGIRSAILLSAHAYVGESTRDPRKYYTNNVVHSIAFVNALLDAGVRNLIFSSSCSIYGVTGTLPITEGSSLDPLSPYAESKYLVERMLDWYGKAYGLHTVCLRYFNAAGADAEGEIGETHDPETHIIPVTILAALGRGELTIFGTDYPTPDGTAIRDYIHVTDLADAHLRAVRYLLAGGVSVQLNLGTGHGTSNLEIIRAVEAHAGRKIPFATGPRREGDAPILVASPVKAAEVLGWKAVHSDLANIVATAWNWLAR